MESNKEVEEIQSVEEMIETIAPGLSQDEYQKIRSDALETARRTRHEWRMRGRGKLYCTSCPIPHASYIPMNMVLTGIDEAGLPILKTLQ